MKKYRKILTVLIIFIVLLSLINSRRVDKTTYSLMVFAEKDRIIKSCNAYRKYKLGIIKEKPILYYSDTDLNEICVSEIKVREFAEKNIKKFFREDWKFIY